MDPERGEIVTQVGAHTISFEAPVLLRIVVRGDVSSEDLRRLIAFTTAETRGCRAVLVMADLRAMGSLSAETRKVAAERVDEIPYRGMAFHGASFQARIFAKLALSVMWLAGPGRNCPAVFVDTEEEARAWIARRMGELEGGAAR
jgi:hypothetical protein